MSRKYLSTLDRRWPWALEGCASWFDLVQTPAATFHFLQDFFHAGSPHEGGWICVPSIQKCRDGLFQVIHAVKGATSHRLLSQFGKPSFDQIQPTGTRWNEVQDKTRMSGQSLPNLRVSMCAVVVENQVQRFARRQLPVQPLEESEELLVPVPLVALPDDPSLGHL